MSNRLLITIMITCFLVTPVTVPAQSGKPAGKIQLDKSIEIVTSQDIRDPDRYLDQFIAMTKDDPIKQDHLQTIKGLERDEKVKWLLGLSGNRETAGTNKSAALAAVCTIVIVTVLVTVVVGYYITAAGIRRAITETQERQQERKVCQ